MQAVQEIVTTDKAFHCLAIDEWARITSILTYSETKVLYYLLSQNPMGDRAIDCRVRTIAEVMGISVGSVSSALKQLEIKGLIESLQIVRAEVNIKPLLMSKKAQEYCDKKGINAVQPTELDVQPTEHDIQPTELDVQPTEHNIQPTEQAHINRSRACIKTNTDSSKLNLKTTTDKKIVAVELKKVDSEQEPEGSYQEDDEIFIELRRLGIKINLTVKKIIVAHRPNVANAIAHLRERIFSGESFKNLEGAFVAACQEGAKPERLVNPPIELPQPDSSQLQELEIAKRDGRIRSYCVYPYNGGKTFLVDDCVNRCVITWWEYLRLDCYEEFEEVEF